jgi:hypothetical protein
MSFINQKTQSYNQPLGCELETTDTGQLCDVPFVQANLAQL